jgi:hypothetical protein
MAKTVKNAQEFTYVSKNDDIKVAFWNEFYRVTEKHRGLIYMIVKSRLSQFPEAADLKNMTNGCIADIERILASQFKAKPGEKRNNKEQVRKLSKFIDDPDYVGKYVFEATRSFCRKKRHYWTHGKNKAKKELGENHKAIKQGRAARDHGHGDTDQVDKWLSQLMSTGFSTSSMSPEAIEDVDSFLRDTGFNEIKIRCFWDRFEGYTFVEMAERSSDDKVTPDMFRKRYKRFMKALGPKLELFKEKVMSDFDFS